MMMMMSTTTHWPWQWTTALKSFQEQAEQSSFRSKIKTIMKLHSLILALAIAACHSVAVEGFVGKAGNGLTRSLAPSNSRLNAGPLQKFSNPKEYNKVVENLMFTQGIDRKQAEKEYDAYLNNPNDYALNKGEAYYKSLGYKNLMDGVIGEAEKEGRGEEVRARIEKFNRESKTKGLITITSFIALGFYLKMTHPYVPPLH